MVTKLGPSFVRKMSCRPASEHMGTQGRGKHNGNTMERHISTGINRYQPLELTEIKLHLHQTTSHLVIRLDTKRLIQVYGHNMHQSWSIHLSYVTNVNRIQMWCSLTSNSFRLHILYVTQMSFETKMTVSTVWCERSASEIWLQCSEAEINSL